MAALIFRDIFGRVSAESLSITEAFPDAAAVLHDVSSVPPF